MVSPSSDSKIHSLAGAAAWVAWFSLAIVVTFASLDSSATAQDLLAERIHRYTFQNADDRDSDLKPDGWRRVLDRKHPRYIDLMIKARDEEAGKAARQGQMLLARLHHAWTTGRWNPNYVPEVLPKVIAEFMDKHVLHKCLHVEMDGGAAERVSPKFPIDARFAYSLRGEICTTNLHGHRACIELHLLDADLNTVEILSTKQISGDSEWLRFDTEVASVPASELKWGQIHVKVEPFESQHFVGSASFDSIDVYRLPRLTLTTELEHHVAEVGVPFDVVCTAMGLRNANSSVKFALHDCCKTRLESESVPLVRLLFKPDALPPTEGEDTFRPLMVSKSVKGYDGAATWSLTLNQPGLYRVRVDLGGHSTKTRQREILITVMPEAENFHAGPFGWSIRQFDKIVRPETLPSLAKRFGASFVKIPIWFDESETERIQQLIQLIDRLQSMGTTCIGRLDIPPKSYGMLDPDQMISLSMLRNLDNWEPMIAPVLTRLGMKLTWFQLGQDDDLSLMSHSDVSGLMLNIRERMQAYSQEIKLSLNWDWLTEPPMSDAGTWDAVQRQLNPKLSAAELDAYLAEPHKGAHTWVNFNPLDSDRYGLLDRVRDLTERAIAIKKSGVRAAFLSDPFDAQHGIFAPDGSAGEMLLPWHTLVSSLGTASYVGEIQLPSGSVNRIFQNKDDGVMLVWNDIPNQERLYLGENVVVTDIWGRNVPVSTEVSPTSGAAEQVLRVDAWPLVVHGVDIQVMRWRQKFKLPVTHLASTLGVKQNVPFEIENTFGQNSNGSMTLFSPSLLGKNLATTRFELGARAKHQRQIPLTIRNDASAGKHDLRFDFDVSGDPSHRFSVYRSMELGIGDVEFMWDAVRLDDNSIQLRLELLNHTTNTVSFDCKIFPKGQAFQRLQVMDAQPGPTQKQIRIKPPKREGGGIWIRCEQIGTGRILNYRVKL